MSLFEINDPFVQTRLNLVRAYLDAFEEALVVEDLEAAYAILETAIEYVAGPVDAGEEAPEQEPIQEEPPVAEPAPEAPVKPEQALEALPAATV